MLIALNKPYGVICQFSPSSGKQTLKNYLSIDHIYPAGRLDTDSEGLMLLTDNGVLQAKITDPRDKIAKTYWAEVEGVASDDALKPLLTGIDLGDFYTVPALSATTIPTPTLWPRHPPVRFRANIPTSWVEITIVEGKNRQIRRMTAHVGLPTLRLVRVGIGRLNLINIKLAPGKWLEISPEIVF